ncbi:MAG: M20 family metallo-hydrolase [Flavisolibacter sp.]
MTSKNNLYYEQSIGLLQQLIAIPSLSKTEDKAADLIEHFLQSKGVITRRFKNNVWAKNKYVKEEKPFLLLNSHHDTVPPNKAYTLDPFLPTLADGKLFGLGTNDAGGSLVSLIAAFLHFYEQKDLNYNLIVAATAEEEISGINGVQSILSDLGPINCALVGEPTQMQMAVAERGLIVLDCHAQGRPGHAARNEGDNAIYKAIKDIEWLQNYEFPLQSPWLGKVKMTVTSIFTENKSHNIIPSDCNFTVDVRTNECYQLEEIVQTVQRSLRSTAHPRSLRLRSTFISLDHPVVVAGLALDLKPYGSPTTSDKALLPFASLKIGPGDSARSHIADEFIYLKEIEDGIDLYIELLTKIIQ